MGWEGWASLGASGISLALSLWASRRASRATSLASDAADTALSADAATSEAAGSAARASQTLLVIGEQVRDLAELVRQQGHGAAGRAVPAATQEARADQVARLT